MSIDLQRANLVDFRFSGCEVQAADFSHARFVGAVHMQKTTFHQRVGFYGTEFTALANFDRSDFDGGAFFSWAQFRGAARFARTSSIGGLRFHHTRFEAEAVFERSKHEFDLEDTSFAREADRPHNNSGDVGH
jgi:hypothetical protein